MNSEERRGNATSTAWGLLLAIISGIIASVTSVLVKYISNIHPAQLVVYRYWCIMSLSLPWLVYSQENFRFPLADRFCLMVLTIATAATSFCEFTAFRCLPVGEAVTLLSSYPTFVAIAGRIFLKESFGLLRVISLLTTIGGLVFVTGLYQALVTKSRIYTTEDVYGFSVGLAAIVAACVSVILIRKLKNIPSSVILFTIGIMTVIEAAVVTLLTDTFRMNYKGLQQVLIILLGIFGYLGRMTLVTAAQFADAGTVSITQAGCNIVGGFVWQIAIFNDAPDALTIIGAILVGLSVLLSGLSKKVNELLSSRGIKHC